MAVRLTKNLWLRPDSNSYPLNDARECLESLSEPVYIYERDGTCFVTRSGELSFDNGNSDLYPLRAMDAPQNEFRFNVRHFLEEHRLAYPYITGGMANGISSADMVITLAKNGLLGFFGTGGIEIEKVEKAIVEIKEKLGQDEVYGFNMVSFDPLYDEKLIDLFLKHGVHRVEIGGAVRITPAMIKYRLNGAYQGDDNRVITPNYIFAKISREEIASQFMSPPPEDIVSKLLAQGKITDQEAQLAGKIPVAADITAEADSGGHTDNRPALILFQNMVLLKQQMIQKYNFGENDIRIGAAGGICTPYTILAAFTLGVDYVLTGSVNQSCVEAGTSDIVKEMLCRMTMSDVSNAPSADMFEMGSQVQVMSKGVMFPLRAKKLFDLYQQYNSIQEIPPNIVKQLEEKFFLQSLDAIWQQTKEYFHTHNPHMVHRAEKNPKTKMGLIFRWYLGMAAAWALQGHMERKVDFQIYCGPSLGAFNRWVKNTYLESAENRKVADIAKILITSTLYLKRITNIIEQGVQLPYELTVIKPNIYY